MHFRDLNEAQVLALAITAEEEDARIYRDFAESLRADFPATAELFARMPEKEDGHRHRLIELYRQRFGEHSSFAIFISQPPSRSWSWPWNCRSLPGFANATWTHRCSRLCFRLS